MKYRIRKVIYIDIEVEREDGLVWFVDKAIDKAEEKPQECWQEESVTATLLD